MHGVEVDMTIWWVASVTPPLKNPGYAPGHDDDDDDDDSFDANLSFFSLAENPPPDLQ